MKTIGFVPAYSLPGAFKMIFCSPQIQGISSYLYEFNLKDGSGRLTTINAVDVAGYDQGCMVPLEQ